MRRSRILDATGCHSRNVMPRRRCALHARGPPPAGRRHAIRKRVVGCSHGKLRVGGLPRLHVSPPFTVMTAPWSAATRITSGYPIEPEAVVVVAAGAPRSERSSLPPSVDFHDTMLPVNTTSGFLGGLHFGEVIATLHEAVVVTLNQLSPRRRTCISRPTLIDVRSLHRRELVRIARRRSRSLSVRVLSTSQPLVRDSTAPASVGPNSPLPDR